MVAINSLYIRKVEKNPLVVEPVVPQKSETCILHKIDGVGIVFEISKRDLEDEQFVGHDLSTTPSDIGFHNHRVFIVVTDKFGIVVVALRSVKFVNTLFLEGAYVVRHSRFTCLLRAFVASRAKKEQLLSDIDGGLITGKMNFAGRAVAEIANNVVATVLAKSTPHLHGMGAVACLARLLEAKIEHIPAPLPV